MNKIKEKNLNKIKERNTFTIEVNPDESSPALRDHANPSILDPMQCLGVLVTNGMAVAVFLHSPPLKISTHGPSHT